jgi:hypothetical protein
MLSNSVFDQPLAEKENLFRRQKKIEKVFKKTECFDSRSVFEDDFLKREVLKRDLFGGVVKIGRNIFRPPSRRRKCFCGEAAPPEPEVINCGPLASEAQSTSPLKPSPTGKHFSTSQPIIQKMK